uniref:Uncharacterized protein n=1 Tax=Arundo donax TaxID=35708 RepID=A0A0A9ATM5_ARUDO
MFKKLIARLQEGQKNSYRVNFPKVFKKISGYTCMCLPENQCHSS